MSGLYLGSTKINDVRVATDTANALADMISALTEKEVEVPSGTDITDIAGLIKAIESGGGEWKVATGSYVPAEKITIGSSGYTFEHGLGEIPSFFAICALHTSRVANSLRLYTLRRGSGTNYYMTAVQSNSAGTDSGYHTGGMKADALAKDTVKIYGYNSNTVLPSSTYYWIAASNGETFT